MNSEERLTFSFPALALHRPISTIVGVFAVAMILAALYFRVEGHMLLPQLNNMDTFTPVMISILMLRGIYALRRDTDLQAVSLSLIMALSFIFIYEAIYKASFYGPGRPMPPPELREFLIQTGIALTVIVGFAFGKFRFSTWSCVFAIAFVLLYGYWMLTGFPQVNTSANVYWVVIPWHYDWDMIYVVNRGTKVLMFLTYLFFYSPVGVGSTQPAARD